MASIFSRDQNFSQFCFFFAFLTYTHTPNYPSNCLHVNLCPSIHPSVHPSDYLFIYLSIHLSIMKVFWHGSSSLLIAPNRCVSPAHRRMRHDPPAQFLHLSARWQLLCMVHIQPHVPVCFQLPKVSYVFVCFIFDSQPQGVS